MLAEAAALRRVVLEVTQACNHRCIHCYNYWERPPQGILAADSLRRADIRELLARIRQDAPLEQVVISGGEPLLRPDLPEILNDMVEDGLAPMVISNTALLTDELAARLPQQTQVETTLFSADRQLHDRIAGPTGAFDRTINGIVAARVRGCSVAVSVVVSALNAHDVYRTIELSLGLGAEAILFNRVNLTPRALKDSPQVIPTLEQLKQALAAAEKVAAKYDTKVAVSVPIPPCLVEPADYPHLHFSFCPRGDDNAYYTISHNGLLRPCNHSSVILGDLRHERFADVIRAARTRAFWAPIPPECQACTHPLAGACRGGCPASADECYGSCAQIDPLVQLLRAQTLPTAPCPAPLVPRFTS